MTTLTLAAGAVAQQYAQTDPFLTTTTVALINATAPAFAQSFTSSASGTVTVAVTPEISGIYGDGQVRVVNGVSHTYDADYADFANAATGPETVVIGPGLTGETDDARAYAQWQGYQAAAVSASNVSGSATLTNAATNDNMPVVNSVTGDLGLRAAAWVTSVTFNQTWSAVGWGQSGFTFPTGGNTIPGTVINGSQTPGDTHNYTANATVSLTQTSQMINGTYGATMTIGLENEQDIQGAAANDLTAATVNVQGTVSSNPTNQTGAYTLNGGTLSAPATTLTGSFTQTGGTSAFASINGTGSMNISGGTATLETGGGLSTLSSLSISGGSSLDITNNHLIIDYAPVTQATEDATIRSYLVAGYAGGAWNGAGGIDSSAAHALFVAGNTHYGLGYADGADLNGSNPLVVGLGVGNIEIKYTLYGDANLDGVVNGTDFGISPPTLAIR